MEEPRRHPSPERGTAGPPDSAVQARRVPSDDRPGRHHTGEEDESESHIVRGVD